MYQLAPLLLHFHQGRKSFRMRKPSLGVLLFRRKLLLSSWGICSQLHSLHLTRNFEKRKVYILLWIWRLLIWCWEESFSLLLFLSWWLQKTRHHMKDPLFSSKSSSCFSHWPRLLPLLWYLLRDFTPFIGHYSTEHFLRARTGLLFWWCGRWLSCFPRFMSYFSGAQWRCTVSCVYTSCF